MKGPNRTEIYDVDLELRKDEEGNVSDYTQLVFSWNPLQGHPSLNGPPCSKYVSFQDFRDKCGCNWMLCLKQKDAFFRSGIHHLPLPKLTPKAETVLFEVLLRCGKFPEFTTSTIMAEALITLSSPLVICIYHHDCEVDLYLETLSPSGGPGQKKLSFCVPKEHQSDAVRRQIWSALERLSSSNKMNHLQVFHRHHLWINPTWTENRRDVDLQSSSINPSDQFTIHVELVKMTKPNVCRFKCCVSCHVSCVA